MVNTPALKIACPLCHAAVGGECFSATGPMGVDVHTERVLMFAQASLPKTTTVGDPINPAHYKGDHVMRIIEEFDLGFCLGNVVKYILRHKAKAGLEDLKKSRWYLDRAIQKMEEGK